MKYKLLALDLDGTLLDSNNLIHSDTLKLIRGAKNKGLYIVIATGRIYKSALTYVNKLNLQGPVISYNGAYVRDSQDKKTIYHKPVNLKLAQKVIADCQQKNLHLNIYIGDQLYVEKKNKLSHNYEINSGVKAEEKGPLDKFIEKPPTKMLAIEENQKRHKKLLNYFKEKYNDQLSITISKSHFIEFIAHGVSKATALKKVIDILDIKQEEVIAVGDSWNDYSMIKWAGTGVAVISADQQIKKEADLIAPLPENNGIGYIIQKYIL